MHMTRLDYSLMADLLPLNCRPYHAVQCMEDKLFRCCSVPSQGTNQYIVKARHRKKKTMFSEQPQYPVYEYQTNRKN